MPKFSDLFTEVLIALSDGKAYPRRELFEKVVEKMDLTDEERGEKIAGGYFRAHDRVHWSCAFLVYAGAIERPQRGYLRITELGRRLLRDNPTGVKLSALEETPGLQDWYARTAAAQLAKKGHLKSGPAATSHPAVNSEGTSPLEQMEIAMLSLKAEVASELLNRLRTEHWSFMERAVLRILMKLGYGKDEEDLFHVGGPFDGGIDGIINQDKLGLDQIYVQSKRYKEGAGISGAAINQFMGAMDRKGVSKGVFITASHFTPEATKAVVENNNKQIVLIDGDELADLMVQYKVGATEVKSFTVFQIDENFFEN